MGRVNKFTDGVFTDIIGNHQQTPDYERFQNLQKTLGNPKGDLKKLLTAYDKHINENKSLFEKLALIEELVMQLRVRDYFANSDIKFNILREYIYARIPFYRTDKETKDIRVIVGLTEFYGEDTDALMKNEEFMVRAREKITSAMDEVININLNHLKQFK